MKLKDKLEFTLEGFQQKCRNGNEKPCWIGRFDFKHKFRGLIYSIPFKYGTYHDDWTGKKAPMSEIRGAISRKIEEYTTYIKNDKDEIKEIEKLIDGIIIMEDEIEKLQELLKLK